MRSIGPLVLLVCAAGQGCTVNEVITAEQTELVVAEEPLEEDLLLDIGIVEFDSGVSEDNDPGDSGVYTEIRDAEARYLPYHLKTTMQGTGYWGAVRVLPSQDAFTDVVIRGRIEESDGEFVTLHVAVEDATGRQWYNRYYTAQTGTSSYSDRRDRRQDPYQKVFNDVANDLQAYASEMPPEDIKRIRQVSELQFFAEMSPAAFGGYLQEDKNGIVSVVRLPAKNDPNAARLRQIRERDRLVVDTLNEHYANFYYGIAIPYEAWRKTSREESINYRQVRRSATLQTLMGVVVLAGSLAVDTDSSSSSTRRMKRSIQSIGISQGFEQIFAGFARRSEASLHVEAIKELSESFGSEAAPMVIEVEGQTRRLTGTAEAQYESWRRLLKEIYEAETGFPASVEVGSPARAPEPTG